MKQNACDTCIMMQISYICILCLYIYMYSMYSICQCDKSSGPTVDHFLFNAEISKPRFRRGASEEGGGHLCGSGEGELLPCGAWAWDILQHCIMRCIWYVYDMHMICIWYAGRFKIGSRQEFFESLWWRRTSVSSWAACCTEPRRKRNHKVLRTQVNTDHHRSPTVSHD